MNKKYDSTDTKNPLDESEVSIDTTNSYFKFNLVSSSLVTLIGLIFLFL